MDANTTAGKGPQAQADELSSPAVAKPVAKKRLSLALQGGGTHGAFTWGAMERLLEDERIEFDGLSGTSAGAINGAMSLIMNVARALAPFGASLLVVVLDGYSLVVWMLAAISVASVVAIAFATPPRRAEEIAI